MYVLFKLVLSLVSSCLKAQIITVGMQLVVKINFSEEKFYTGLLSIISFPSVNKSESLPRVP